MIVSRDSPDYPWDDRPTDHNVVGLFIFGPHGEHNAIARLQKYTHCPVTAATPENERKALVHTRAVASEQRRADGTYQEPAQVRVGRYLYPKKPANSGRRRKSARNSVTE